MSQILVDHFGEEYVKKPPVKIRLNDHQLCIGKACYDRQIEVHGRVIQSTRLNHLLCSSFVHIQENLLHCIERRWLSIIVGDENLGKSSLITNLATLVGMEVIEIQLHQGTDISDLLGGFEQIDTHRQIQEVLSDCEGFFEFMCFRTLVCKGDLLALMSLWKRVFGCQNLDGLSVAKSIQRNKGKLQGIVSGQNDFSPQRKLDLLLQKADSLLDRCSSSNEGKFEWVDGTLTRSIESGTWVILKDANLCNPSVLDRLNPLMEPNGYLSLNECGSGVDGPRKIYPHRNFRLFITYDSSSGEISRAMRNRGIEISLQPDQATGLPIMRSRENTDTEEQRTQDLGAIAYLPSLHPSVSTFISDITCIIRNGVHDNCG